VKKTEKTSRRTTLPAGAAPSALAALSVLMQSTAAFASQEVDLQTLKLHREESMSDQEFSAAFTERKLNSRRAVIGGNSYSRQSITGSSYSRQSITGSSYSRQSITGSSYSRQSITGSSYSRQSITGSSYSRQSITSGSYSRQSITGQGLYDSAAGAPIPGPIVGFEED
jgi:hypothetical protein